MENNTMQNNNLKNDQAVQRHFSKYRNTEEDLCFICFHTPEECTCGDDIKPLFLPIDKGLHEHMAVLNNKGYRTSFCCEGHNPNDEMYLSFSSTFDFNIILNNPPANFKATKSNRTIRYRFNKNLSQKELELQKRQQLNILLNWAKKLPKTKNADMIKNIMINTNRKK